MNQRINLGAKHHKILQKEFSHVSKQTIQNALNYFNNSETAQAIRVRALEIIEEDLKLNKKFHKEISLSTD